jgi:hypothetical protein
MTASGPLPTAVSSLRIDNPAFTVTSDACSGRVLSAGETCAIAVKFEPSASGSFEGALSVDSDSEGAQRPVALSGALVSRVTAASTTAHTKQFKRVHVTIGRATLRSGALRAVVKASWSAGIDTRGRLVCGRSARLFGARRGGGWKSLRSATPHRASVRCAARFAVKLSPAKRGKRVDLRVKLYGASGVKMKTARTSIRVR